MFILEKFVDVLGPVEDCYGPKVFACFIFIVSSFSRILNYPVMQISWNCDEIITKLLWNMKVI